jgi:hypothetical protein
LPWVGLDDPEAPDSSYGLILLEEAEVAEIPTSKVKTSSSFSGTATTMFERYQIVFLNLSLH